ncbi:hypothetical protein EON63_05925 [archaeon]|nr:MAG: hypothetical protein EON63_05925 [archaeon]
MRGQHFNYIYSELGELLRPNVLYLAISQGDVGLGMWSCVCVWCICSVLAPYYYGAYIHHTSACMSYAIPYYATHHIIPYSIIVSRQDRHEIPEYLCTVCGGLWTCHTTLD